MPLDIGKRLGSYSVTAKIGEGGMGEVYRARDTKLDRDVALKVLPQAFTDDPDRLARFEREAKVLASLNHPNIGHIYGLEEAEGQQALVLELVEGPTLADKIAQGPIPVDEALPIARQIAEALEAAHEQGIIHRDLKPANIKVRDDGTVKVLDFGLAKAFQPEAPDVSASMSPTISLTAAATQMGMVIGTAAYMAPEQAKGLPVDKRADIWAFGAVLFEMLTGKKLFETGDVSEMLASVLVKDPDISSIGTHVPEYVRSVIRHCLVKDPRERLRDIGDVRLAMKGRFETTIAALNDPSAEPSFRPRYRPVPVVLLAAVLMVITGLVVWTVTRPEVGSADLVRFVIVPPVDAPLRFGGGRPDLVISRDGTKLIYQGPNPAGGTPQLNLRPLDQFEGSPLRGGEGGLGPFVSPNGEWIGFVPVGGNTLQKVSTFGGPPVAITESPHGIFGASWGSDDQVIFGSVGGLFRVSGGGGEPEQITTPEQGESGHAWPFIIEGREAVLFEIVGGGSGNSLTTGEVAVLDVTTGDVTPLGLAGVSPRYVSTGHLVYAAADRSVRAVPFDVSTLQVTGTPVPLLEGVWVKPTGAANFSISDNGRLVYALGNSGAFGIGTLLLVDRQGNERELPVPPDGYRLPRFSPDGTRIAIEIEAGDESNIFIYEIADSRLRQLTFDGGAVPLWTPDGTQITYLGNDALWNIASDFSEEPELLSDPSDEFGIAGPYSWSPDGRVLFWDGAGGVTQLTVLDGGEVEHGPLLVESYSEAHATFSADGAWFSYATNETGGYEVYVQPYPLGSGAKRRITQGGGDHSVWSRNGQELFYISDGQLWALRIETEPTLIWEDPVALFDTPWPTEVGTFVNFDVTSDGQQFVFVRPQGEDIASDPQINVVLNWHRELLERVPIP